jgi:hypothetical protein
MNWVSVALIPGRLVEWLEAYFRRQLVHRQSELLQEDGQAVRAVGTLGKDENLLHRLGPDVINHFTSVIYECL